MSIALLDKQPLLLSNPPDDPPTGPNGPLGGPDGGGPLLGPCDAHGECADGEFCNEFGFCLDCTKCLYHYDAIDGQCPEICPALCEEDGDVPPNPFTCPLCDTEEECQDLYDEDEFDGKPWPTCDDGSDRCVISDECEHALVAWHEDVNQMYLHWDWQAEEAGPGLSDWPEAGPISCECMSQLADCILEAQCYHPEKLDNDVDSLPFSLKEFCEDAMKCTNDHCGWTDHDALNPSFLSMHASTMQKKTFQKYYHKKKMHNALKMQKIAAH